MKPSITFMQEREENEVYGRFLEDTAYLLYFPNEGSVKLNLDPNQKYKLEKVHLLSSREIDVPPMTELDDTIVNRDRHVLFLISVDK